MRKAWPFVIPVAIVVLVICMRLRARDATSDAAMDDARTVLLQPLPEYGTDRAYFDRLLESSHTEAFNDAFRRAARRHAAAFDQQVYLEELMFLMIRKARTDGREEIAAALEVRRDTRRQPLVSAE